MDNIYGQKPYRLHYYLPVVDATEEKAAVIAKKTTINLTITEVIIARVKQLCYLPELQQHPGSPSAT